MTYLWLRISNFVESELIWNNKRVKSTENVDSWITGIPSLIPVRHLRRNDLGVHQFRISRKKNTCYTRVRLTCQCLPKNYKSKVWVAHLRNNCLERYKYSILVIHDTVQYLKTNDIIYIYSCRFLNLYDLDVSMFGSHCGWGYGGLFETLIQDMLSINIAMFILWKFLPDFNYYINYIGRC